MKTIHNAVLAIALAGSTLAVQAQDQRKENAPEYYAVYESAFHETSKLGINPTEKIYITDVDVRSGNIAISFKEPVNGSAIINVYDEKGRMLLNQYMELNGTKTEFPLYGTLKNGIQFLHVFTERSEAIYQFNNENYNPN